MAQSQQRLNSACVQKFNAWAWENEQLEAGFGMDLIRGFLLILLLLLLIFLYGVQQYRGLQNVTGMEMAQLGRQYAVGYGYRTLVLRPADLAMLTPGLESLPQGEDHFGVPEIRYPPLHPALLSLFFRWIPQNGTEPLRPMEIFELEKRVILPVNIGLAVGLLALTLWLSRSLVGGRLAFRASLLLIAGGGIVPAVFLNDASLTAAIFLFTGIWIFLRMLRLRLQERLLPALALSTLAGAVFALACLSHYAALVMLPVLLVIGLAGAARGRVLLLFLVGWMLVMIPWGIRNVRVSGQPFGSALESMVLSNMDEAMVSAYEREPVPFMERSAAGWQQIGRVMRSKAADPQVLSRMAIWLLVPSLLFLVFLVPVSDRSLFKECAGRLLAGGGLAALAGCFLLGIASMEWQQAALVMAAPWLCLAVAMALQSVIASLAKDPVAIGDVGYTLLLGGMALPLLLRLAIPGHGFPYPPYHPPLIREVCRSVAPDRLLSTDIPWATAWYGRRLSLLLPMSPDHLLEVTTTLRLPPPGGLYLTQQSAGDRAWQEVRHGRLPEGFGFTHGFYFPPGTREQVFLAPSFE